MKLYLDASAIIYSIEGIAGVRQMVLDRVARAEQSPDGRILTSRLSRLECRVLPLRRNQTALLSTYEQFFAQQALTIAELTATVIERATSLRARYGLKTPDAIHIATAVEQQADLILTGDRDFARCADIKVEIL